MEQMNRGRRQMRNLDQCSMNFGVTVCRLSHSITVVLEKLVDTAWTVTSCHVPRKIFAGGHSPRNLKLARQLLLKSKR